METLRIVPSAAGDALTTRLHVCKPRQSRSLRTAIILRCVFLPLLLVGFMLSFAAASDEDSLVVIHPSGAPVILDGDTLFYLTAHLGAFTPHQRASALASRLELIARSDTLALDSLRVVDATISSNLVLGTTLLMAVTDDDAAPLGKTRRQLASEYAGVVETALRAYHERYSASSLLKDGIITGVTLLGLLLLFWLFSKIFPRLYDTLERWEGSVFRSITFRSQELVSAGVISGVFILLAKGIRLALSLWAIYLLLTLNLAAYPWTRTWNVKPVLGGVLLLVLLTVAVIGITKGVNAFFRMLRSKIPAWKGTLIKPVRIKAAEVLSVGRIAESLDMLTRGLHLVLLVVVTYFYTTFAFSIFPFTRTWSATLFGYVTDPIWDAFVAFVTYLPNLFYILIILFLTRYVLKFVRLGFHEIERGTIALPGFYREWAQPTYKIVRFLVFVFAAIVIFPYLPGSDSPFFRGISVFLGILFSLGSSSAIANMVAGIVITYMRPFKIGDRVKIADTMGDVVEKTLLVTRVRTVKNVDITIPNAMVLASHIINFSSSAKDRGLILHTAVTIGYDVPWTQVHQLLLAAAEATEGILKEPKPFVLQTSLGDFYVSYELNVHTDSAVGMAEKYSELHRNIQDKFNEAGVEIMSPHYTAMRDGNQVTVPQQYLPKSYQAPAFRIFPFGGFSDKGAKSE